MLRVYAVILQQDQKMEKPYRIESFREALTEVSAMYALSYLQHGVVRAILTNSELHAQNDAENALAIECA